MKKNKLPNGVDQAEINAVIRHYESQTEDEAVTEDEAAFDSRRFASVQVPIERLPEVLVLLETSRGRTAPATKVAENRSIYPKER